MFVFFVVVAVFCVFGWWGVVSIVSERVKAKADAVKDNGVDSEVAPGVTFVPFHVRDRARFDALLGLSVGGEFGFVGKRWVGQRFRVMNMLPTGFQYSVVGSDGRTRDQRFMKYAEACKRVVV